MDIISIFYSEFDIYTGDNLMFQYPYDVVSTDFHKKISYFVIPNPNLCGKLNVLKLSDPDLKMVIGKSNDGENEERSFTDKIPNYREPQEEMDELESQYVEQDSKLDHQVEKEEQV